MSGRSPRMGLGSVTTMHSVPHLREACSRVREFLALLSDEAGWDVVATLGAGVEMAHGATGAIVRAQHDDATDSLDVSFELPDGRLADIRHVLPTLVQIDLCRDAVRPSDVVALVSPMLRLCESAMPRDPSPLPIDGALLHSICDNFASACMAEGHSLRHVEIRPWIDGMTRITGHLPDGTTVEPVLEARAALLEGWSTSVEIALSGYADHGSRRKGIALADAAGIRMSICVQEGLIVEDFEGDVVAAMRWAAAPPAPLPLFTLREPEPSPF